MLVRGAATADQLDISPPTLGFEQELELRSPPYALQLFGVDEICEPDRVPTDTSSMSVAELETADPGGLDGRWIHLIGTALVIMAALGVLRWRGTGSEDQLAEDAAVPSEHPVDDGPGQPAPESSPAPDPAPVTRAPPALQFVRTVTAPSDETVPLIVPLPV